jgi:hypothetical protein
MIRSPYCAPFRYALYALVLAWGLSLPAQAQEPPSPAPEAEAEAEEVIQVVYHADFKDPRRFSAMLTNINNMVMTYQQELAEYDIRVVFVSHGIRFLTKDPLKGTPFAEDTELKKRRADLMARLQSLQTQGVTLELCNITREAVRLDEGKLIEGVELVPSGVVRIVELQSQGYAYLKIE